MYIYIDIVEGFSCEMCGTCCRNDWLVTVDEQHYRRNAELFMATGRSEEFPNAFIPLQGNSLAEYAYIAKQASGGCWFLDASNLCRLHREAGHDHLDPVCQTFPRYPMSTARGIELTLSFSCPAVIRLASRTAPLAMIRSERQPLALAPNNYVVEVYPHQQPAYSPLRYYFELEHHFIDIMQCRSITTGERLALIEKTVRAFGCLQQDDSFSQKLNRIFYTNYDYLDAKAADGQPGFHQIPDILIENFFVNFIFKKPFYIYGLECTAKLLGSIWQHIEKARRHDADPQEDIKRTQSVIMDIEFQYSHNRRALLACQT